VLGVLPTTGVRTSYVFSVGFSYYKLMQVNEENIFCAKYKLKLVEITTADMWIFV
jgi:hypothetical protein